MGERASPVQLLLVESNPSDAAAVDAELAGVSREFVLRHVENLSAAVRRLRQGGVDVILLDLNLADSQGMATFARIHGQAPDTPVVILSAHQDEELAARAVRQGAQDYLLKGASDGPSLIRALRYAIERTRRDRAENELIAAGVIQQRLLPRTSCELLGFDISGRCLPANYAGGDYFDVFPMRQDQLGVVIADAAGHGIGPAITMSETRAVIRTLATIFNDVGEILTRASYILAKDLTEQTFVALFLACLDARSRSLQFAAAGHSGLVLDRSGRTKRLLKSTDPPLGITRGQEYTSSAPIPLEANEALFLFTDGLIECQGSDGARFGNKRLIDAVQTEYAAGAQQVLETVFQQVRAFVDQNSPADDMTAVLVKAAVAVETPDARQETPDFSPAESFEHFEADQRDDAVVLYLTDSEILTSETCTELQQELVQFVHHKKPPRLVVSLRKVGRFSSEGINVFLRLRKAVKAENAAFRLCEMQPQIREAFQALNLDGTILTIRDDVQDALGSF